MGKTIGVVSGAIALLGSLVLATACGPRSMVDPEDEIVVSGTLLGTEGEPMVAQRVRMVREPSLGELLSFVANPIGVGLWCIARELEEEPGCLTFRRADTDGQGDYAMAMTGSETQKEFGAARHFWVGSSAGGASVGVGFYVQDPMVIVPDVMLWDGVATASDEGAELVLAWPAARLSPSDPRVDAYSIEIEDDAGAPIWEAGGLTANELRIDRAILEDVAIVHRVSAHTTRAGSGTEFDVVQTAPSGTAPAGTYQPASRGAACTYRNGAGAEMVLSPCPITDGDFGTFVSREDEMVCAVDSDGQCTGASFEEIVIDLGAVRAAPAIVVHATGTPSNERTGVALEASADGVAWSSVATTLAPFRVHAGPAATRFVRLRRTLDEGDPGDTAFTQLVNEIAID